MSIIEKVNSSNDIKNLNNRELSQFCDEARAFLIESMSHTGGHLASNLGTVELSVALHRVYDTSKDRLVFDVGHQSYVHKMITGRREMFSTLRQHGGLSGFPKPYESDDDAFIAGHASNSVSVALGMASKAIELGPDGAIVRNITLFAVLIYELVGPLLTKMALTAAGEITPMSEEVKNRRQTMLEGKKVKQ